MRGYAYRSRPHDTDRKAAERASDQAENRSCRERRKKIAGDTEDPGKDHEFYNIHVFAVLSVENPAQAHQNRKQTGSRQVSDRFGDAERGLRKRGGPLRHCKFRCAGTDHKQDQQPEQRCFYQLSACHALSIFYEMLDRADSKVSYIHQWYERPEAGQDPPASGAEDREKHR